MTVCKSRAVCAIRRCRICHPCTTAGHGVLPAHSVLDLWLMMVFCVWVFDIALASVSNAGRFDVGWYAGRIYGNRELDMFSYSAAHDLHAPLQGAGQRRDVLLHAARKSGRGCDDGGGVSFAVTSRLVPGKASSPASISEQRHQQRVVTGEHQRAASPATRRHRGDRATLVTSGTCRQRQRFSGGIALISAENTACVAASTGRCFTFVLAGSLPR